MFFKINVGSDEFASFFHAHGCNSSSRCLRAAQHRLYSRWCEFSSFKPGTVEYLSDVNPTAQMTLATPLRPIPGQTSTRRRSTLLQVQDSWSPSSTPTNSAARVGQHSSQVYIFRCVLLLPPVSSQSNARGPGRYPWRQTSARNNYFPASSPDGIDLAYNMVPARLASKGYVSYHVGKWCVFSRYRCTAVSDMGACVRLILCPSFGPGTRASSHPSTSRFLAASTSRTASSVAAKTTLSSGASSESRVPASSPTRPATSGKRTSLPRSLLGSIRVPDSPR